jgi:hypothetical protein
MILATNGRTLAVPFANITSGPAVHDERGPGELRERITAQGALRER